jgi:hypothetical protein
MMQVCGGYDEPWFEWHDSALAPKKGKPTIETLVTRLFRDGVQFCSGLVDLVVCVCRDFGGGHRFALAGERFVGLVAEDIS